VSSSGLGTGIGSGSFVVVSSDSSPESISTSPSAAILRRLACALGILVLFRSRRRVTVGRSPDVPFASRLWHVHWPYR
jgi:hypothetical protein